MSRNYTSDKDSPMVGKEMERRQMWWCMNNFPTFAYFSYSGPTE